jgi:hypothetical protein
MKPPKHKRPKRTARVSREIAKSRRITARVSKRWHKQDGKKASKRQSLVADLLGAAIGSFVAHIAAPYLPDVKNAKTAAKSRQIGKENPQDVVIDVKPERIE